MFEKNSCRMKSPDSFVGIGSVWGSPAQDPILPDGFTSSTRSQTANGSAGCIIQGIQCFLHPSAVLYSQTLWRLNA